MKRLVSLDGVETELDWHRDGDRIRFRMNGQTREVSLVEVEPGIYSVLLGGRSFEVKVTAPSRTATGDRQFLQVQGRRIEVSVRDPRNEAAAAGRRAAPGREYIASPMPGRVVRTLVREGDPVQPGAGVVIVEAMKMQNEMKTAKGGTIVSMCAREGAVVAAGETLVVVE